MITLPLETRQYDKVEEFHLNLVLEQNKTYEMSVINIYHEGKLPDGIGQITCDAVNPSFTNPQQVLSRFCRYPSRNTEYYIIDTFNLRTLRLKLSGIPPTPLAITLGIKEVRNA